MGRTERATEHPAGGIVDASEGNLGNWLAAIVSSSNDAIVSKNLEGTVTTWNRAAERIFGYRADEMVGQSIKKIVPPELHYEEDAILAQLRRGESVEHFDTVRVAKGGRRVDVSLTISPVRDRTGRIVGASKVARDITERKREEQLRDLLVNELNHRVKNSLSTVQSIAAQTFAGLPGAQERLGVLRKRLTSLAINQDLLTSNNWEGVHLHELLAAVLAPFSDGGTRIEIGQGVVALLSPRQASALTMAVHELATNASKYGALSNEGGHVEVAWTSEPDDGKLELLWSERGGPTVVAPQTTGFGTRVMTEGLRHELGGESELLYPPEGMQFRARFQAQATEQPSATSPSVGE